MPKKLFLVEFGSPDAIGSLFGGYAQASKFVVAEDFEEAETKGLDWAASQGRPSVIGPDGSLVPTDDSLTLKNIKLVSKEIIW